MATLKTSRHQAERSTETRDRILDAALQEFSAHGLAGARTEAIAVAAGVNKALLYYYFESKEKLYLETLEKIAGKVRDAQLALLTSEASPGERLLQQEMIRIQKGESKALPFLGKRLFGPTLLAFQAMVEEGMASGELIDVDWMQFPLVALGANVFYFLSAPMWHEVLPFEPFAPEVIAFRRKALVEFLGQAVFKDRVHGAELAGRVLADSPAPVPAVRAPFKKRLSIAEEQ